APCGGARRCRLGAGGGLAVDAARAARLVEHVFAGEGPVYALLDAARGERVYDAVRGCGRPFEPLYDGKLAPELAGVAPYLVELAADHPFTGQLLGEGWGDSWGCFLSAPVDLRGLRRHLRRFLKVRTENRKTLVFRYYDPRVLRLYLPTCTPGELDTF